MPKRLLTPVHEHWLVVLGPLNWANQGGVYPFPSRASATRFGRKYRAMGRRAHLVSRFGRKVSIS